jgi:DNA polymerase V
MGVPVFQIQDLIKQHNIQVLSVISLCMVKCPALYGASREYVAPGEQEVYSIDECFLKLTAYEHLFDLNMRKI